MIFVPGVGPGCTSHPTLVLIWSASLKLWVLHSLMDGPARVCLQSEATRCAKAADLGVTPVPGPGSLLCYLTWWSLSFHICEWASRACASKPACEDGGISEMHKGGPHWSSAPLAYPPPPRTLGSRGQLPRQGPRQSRWALTSLVQSRAYLFTNPKWPKSLQREGGGPEWQRPP